MLTFHSRPSNKKMIYFSLKNNNYYAINLNKAWNATRHFACKIFSITIGITYFMFFLRYRLLCYLFAVYFCLIDVLGVRIILMFLCCFVECVIIIRPICNV